MRTFIAIELERDVRDYLAAVQTEVQGLCRRGNFTPVDNLHLTLHFLGEVGESDLEYLQDAMYEAALRYFGQGWRKVRRCKGCFLR